MDRTIRITLYLLSAFWTGAGAAPAGAEIFYAGQPKGLPGQAVELTVNARAGTILEALDIVPDIDGVASVLSFVSLTGTPALTDGGTGSCISDGCAFFYLPEKSFAADAVLATLRFTIDPGAPVGPVAFDPGVVVGETALPIPPGAGFEVLAVPEPESWMLLAAGIALLALATRRFRA
jgi:hypothetical protein